MTDIWFRIVERFNNFASGDDVTPAAPGKKVVSYATCPLFIRSICLGNTWKLFLGRGFRRDWPPTGELFVGEETFRKEFSSKNFARREGDFVIKFAHYLNTVFVIGKYTEIFRRERFSIEFFRRERFSIENFLRKGGSCGMI